VGRVFGGFGFNDLVSPPRTPRLRPPAIGVIVNNQPIELSPNLALNVFNAITKLRLNPEDARTLDKELLLRADILIGLINETKVGLQEENHDLFVSEYQGNNRVEQAFIDNRSLRPDEKKWVEKTIADYKWKVKSAVSQNTSRPITPPPSSISVRACNMQ